MSYRASTGSQRAQSLLILAVFGVFLANAMGLTSFHVSVGGSVRLNPQVVDALLSGDVPDQFRHPDFVAFVAVGLLLALALPMLPPIGASALTFAAMLPPLYAAWVSPVPPPLVPFEYSLLTILVLFTVNVLVAYFVETHARLKITAAFGQYVPPAVVSAISRQPDAFSMAGEAREMTVLFCDVRGFSAIAEQLEPRELAALLNRYLTAMTAVLHRHGATIDKYVGDAVMAFWGAPLAQADHAARGVAAAIDMQRRMHGVREEFARRGWPAIRIGIGVASGMMNVGNMGSRYRIAYTVIGDEVNLAARLEGLTKLYDVGILISAATRAACAELPCREIDHVRARGKDRATRIFEPLADGGWPSRHGALHQRALDAYYSGDWAVAGAAFDELAAANPDDGYYGAMGARLTRGAPPAAWSGVVVFGGELGWSFEGSSASVDAAS